MPLLFAYGTLQQEDVQLSTLGRRLSGWRDDLVAYEPSLVAIEDPRVVAELGKTHHNNVTFTGNDKNCVAGTAFEVTDAELTLIDSYEIAFFYTRVSARLASGQDAWVYVHRGVADGEHP